MTHVVRASPDSRSVALSGRIVPMRTVLLAIALGLFIESVDKLRIAGIEDTVAVVHELSTT